jgi:hypothetical protein
LAVSLATGGANAPAVGARPRRRPSALGALDRWILACYAAWLILVGAGLLISLHVFAPTLSLHEGFRNVVVNSDAGWLRQIDIRGYQWNGSTTVTSDIAFLPLYPLVVGAVHALGLGWNGAAVLVSVLCQGAMLVLLGRLLLECEASRRQVRWAIGFALLYPAALFAVTGFATSMLGLLVVGALLAYRRDHVTTAFALAGLATAVYYTGLALPAALVVAELRARGVRAVVSPAGLGRMLLGVSGVLAFMAYLGVRFHRPFASLAVQQAWTGTAPLSTVLRRMVTLSPVPNGPLDYIGQRQLADLSHLLDAPFLILLVVVAVWLLCGRHGIEGWLVAGGAALVLYNSAKAGYPFSVIRLSYPFWVVLPMNPRVRGLMDRISWTVPYLGCLAISCFWLTLLAQRLFTD